MQKKMIVKSSHAMLFFMLLSLPLSSQGTIAYIPQVLKECISVANNIDQWEHDTRNLQELDAMIKEGRILASDTMTRKAVEEALDLVHIHKNEFRDDKQQAAIAKYLKEYFNSLDNKFLLLAMQGEGVPASWPVSFITRSLPDRSVETDMMHLNSELATTVNMPLCGNRGIDASSYRDLNGRTLARALKNNVKRDPSVAFNANMMTNSLLNSPSITFGTGVSSPSIDAWIMPASNTVQTPINMQFAAPDDLKAGKKMDLELHFLVQHNGQPKGKARVEVTEKHIGSGEDFSIEGSAHTSTIKSDNFKVKEPNDVNNLKHIVVKISLSKSHIKHGDLVLLSLTRIAPSSGTEYEGDIYLAASTFTYST